MRAFLALMVLAFTAGLAAAQTAPPVTPPPPPAGTLPDWVARYAGMQEQAARACQIQLSQEQVKLEQLQKELADAKGAAASTTAAPKK